MEGNVFVKLRIAGQGMDFEEIAQNLLRQPSFAYHKGDCYTPKYGDRQSMTYEEDCMIFETSQDEETLEGTILSFVSKFESSREYLKDLAGKYDVTLWVSVYPDNEQNNIHLDNNTLKILTDMGLTVDFNIMFLKELYEGTYTE